MAEMDILFTVQEVAFRLGVSRGSVYELVKQGRLAAHRVGSGRGTIRISEADLRTYLKRCRSGGEEETENRKIRTPRRALKHIRVGRAG